MLLSLALSAVLLVAPQDSVRVQASLSASRVPAGGTAVLLVTVETDGAAPDEIPLPVLAPGLDVGPVSDFSQLQVAFPGGRTRVTRREIVLLGREPGEYRIPSIAVRVNGRTYATSALNITVLPGDAVVTPTAADPVRLRAWLQPDTVYVGQQSLYQAEALLPEEIRTRQARSPDFLPPATTGLWVYDAADPITVSLRMIGNAVFEVQNFRQVFFPLTPGSIEIPAARMRYEIRQGFAFTPDRREVVSQPVTLFVKPLPEGAPPSFAGAVGSYQVSAELSAATVAAGEPVTLRVIVEGSGNVKGLPRPELPELDDVDVFVGAERSESGVAEGRVSGRKLMEWTLVPHQRGALAVPPISYTWFDPDRGEYRVAETAPLQIEVTPARRGAGSDTALAPLRAAPARTPLAWTTTPGFIIAQLLPPLLVAAFWFRRRAPRRGRSDATGRSALDRAGAQLDDPRACLDELAAYLRAHDQGAELLARVRAARYAPVPATREQCEELLAAARALPTSTKARASALPLLTLLLLSAQPDAGTPFERGMNAYASGEYEHAARAWTEQVRAQPHDHASWYNLGNAWARQEQPGRAVWAWLHALRLDPRDDWARANLRFTGAAHALEDLAPRVPIRTDELAFFAALCWWLAWLLLALHRRRAAAACLAPMVILLALAGARAAADAGAVTLQPLALRSAPALQAEPIAELDPGEPLVILRERGTWLLARSYDLREGWVPAADVGRMDATQITASAEAAQ